MYEAKLSNAEVLLQLAFVGSSSENGRPQTQLANVAALI